MAATCAYVRCVSYASLLADVRTCGSYNPAKSHVLRALSFDCCSPLYRACFLHIFERYRVLFVNCIGLGYGSFLSYAANDLQVASANEEGEGVSIGDTDVLVSEHPR